MQFFQEAFLNSEKEAMDPMFSPMLHEDHSGLPPAFIQVCEKDLLRDEGIAYGQKMSDAGVRTVTKIYMGHPHGICNMLVLKEAKLMLRDLLLELENHDMAYRPWTKKKKKKKNDS